MQELEVQFIEPGDCRWQSLVERQREANIFHHPAWLELLKQCYGYHPFILSWCDVKGSIQAGLPVMEVKHPGRRRRWISLPFTDHCMPLSVGSYSMDSLSNLIQSLANSPASPRMEIRWDLFRSDIPPASSEYVLHTLQLGSSVEEVQHRIHHSHRRNVRVALDHGIRIKRGTDRSDLDAFYALHLETRHRQGVPIQPARYFRLLNDILLRRGLGFISLAYNGSQCLAAAVFLHWNRTLTYKYGASRKEGLSFRPNHLIFWDAIQWGCDRGYSVLDFGRSDWENNGLRVFKTRWGAQEVPLQYFQCPSKTRSAGKEHRLMFLTQTLIRKSPSWICRLGGEIYYRFVA